MTEPTPYKDINRIAAKFAEELKKIFGPQLVGLYLTGSLAYGGFNRPSSDLDFAVVLKEPLSDSQRKKIKAMHADVEKLYPEWEKRIEMPYLLQSSLRSTKSPKEPQVRFNASRLWDPDPTYGSNWLVNIYAIREYGIVLSGPKPESLIPPMNIKDVQKASSRGLHSRWEKKLDSSQPFGNGEDWSVDLMKAYSVLTMCRKLYRAKNDGPDSKRIASKWVKAKYPEWKALIEEAENWHEGQSMTAHDEILDFIRFTLDQVD